MSELARCPDCGQEPQQEYVTLGMDLFRVAVCSCEVLVPVEKWNRHCRRYRKASMFEWLERRFSGKDSYWDMCLELARNWWRGRKRHG
jgi:hypothetical protein